VAKGKIIKGKYGKLGRAKPPAHPLGTPFQGDEHVGPGNVLHGVPARGDRAGNMEGKMKGSGVPGFASKGPKTITKKAGGN
jgi:hypothetical protein